MIPFVRLAVLWVVCAVAAPAAGAADAPARVLLIATYHLSNPGQDLANVKVDDVLAPARQSELQALAQALARFEPTLVAVEWPEDLVNERYPKFLDGTLPASRNEVVQIGFRLARERGLRQVHGIDVDGDFPFDAVQAWAKEHGRLGEVEGVLAMVTGEVEKLTALQATSTIGGMLRHMNEPEAIARNHSFYPAMLRFGGGAEQPGVALLSAWYARNLAICARLLQLMKPGDRAVVLYGQGHAYLLSQCLDEAEGVERADPLAWLPKER